MNRQYWFVLMSFVFLTHSARAEKTDAAAEIEDMMGCYRAQGTWLEDDAMTGCRINGKAVGLWPLGSFASLPPTPVPCDNVHACTA